MTQYLLPSLLGSLALATVACAGMDSDEAASASSTTQGLTAAEEGSGEARGRRGHRRGPPQQAIEACADASAGDECTFDNRRGDAMSGNCVDRPRADGLACRPEGRGGPGYGHGRRGHRRGPPQQAIDVCADASADDECSFESRRRGDMQGNCVDHPRIEGLVCRPEGFGGRGPHGPGPRGPGR